MSVKTYEIAYDKSFKTSHFSNTLIEIEAQPLDAELVPIKSEATVSSNALPFTYTQRSRSLKQCVEHKCEICSLSFRTVTELNAHRQGGCERPIRIISNIMDSTADDFSNAEKYTIKREYGITVNGQMKNVKIVRRRHKPQTDAAKKAVQIKNQKDDEQECSGENDEQTDKGRHECPLCDKSYVNCSSVFLY